jgi:hypothetical protein
MVDGNPSRGEDDLPRRRPWMRPSSEHRAFLPSSRVRPSGSGTVTCAVQQASRVHGPLGASSARSPVHAAATKVLDLCSREEGRVFAPSTKKFTEVPRRIHLSAYSARVKVYNAGTGARPSERRPEWIKWSARLQLASLRGAFVVEHFDCLVGYLVNSQFAWAWRRASSGSSESVSSATDAPVCAQRTPGVLPCETEIDALLTEDPCSHPSTS